MSPKRRAEHRVSNKLSAAMRDYCNMRGGLVGEQLLHADYIPNPLTRWSEADRTSIWGVPIEEEYRVYNRQSKHSSSEQGGSG